MTQDFISLASWINPEHLVPEKIDAYRHEFEQHSVGFLQIENFLNVAIASEIATFLVNHGRFEDAYGLFSVDDHATTAKDWDKASQDDRFFRFDSLINDHPDHQKYPEFVTYKQLRRACLQPAYHHYITALTGVSLIGTRVERANRMSQGQYIKPHSDRKSNRRLTTLFYFSPDWRPEYGGQLLVTGNKGETVRVETKFNSCVIFDIQKHHEHEVTPILPIAQNHVRLSMACRLHEKKNNENIPS